MADTKISNLTELTSADNNDVLPIVDTSATTTKKIQKSNLVAGLLVAANNLSDVTASTARTNLGLGTLATQSGTFSGTSSGTNTGDQTSVSGNAGTATALQNARTIGGVSFNGTENITVASATGGFTVSGGDLALGANNITVTGSIASTGSRVTKGWFTDLEVTNAPTLNGVAIPSISSTNTLSNKRLTRRVVTVTQSATPTINTDNTDVAYITGLAQAVTSFTTNLSGTPVNGDTLIIDITDDGTARALTFGASFEASGTVPLPTTTVISTKLTMAFRWNIATSKWTIVAVA